MKTIGIVALMLTVLISSTDGFAAKRKSVRPSKPMGTSTKKLKVAELVEARAPLLAIEDLLQSQTKDVSENTVRAVLKLAPASHNAWKLVQTPLTQSWATRLGPAISSQVRIYQAIGLQNESQKRDIEASLKTLDKKSDTYSLGQFLLASYEGRTGQLMNAFTRLDALRSSDQSVIDHDLIALNIARLYFEQGDFESAIKNYDLIPKGSDYWLEALEEKAWAEFRLKDYDRSESLLFSVLSPVFEGIVGPEPYFVSGYSKLKVCDYPGIFKTIQSFKKKYEFRLGEIEKLSEGFRSDAVTRVLAKMSTGTIDYKELGRDALYLPRLIHRDNGLARLMMNRQMVTNEVSHLQQTNPNLALAYSPLIQKLQGKGYDYVKALAQTEMDEAAKIINKLHILEAEAIQRMHINNKKANRDIKPKEVDGDELQFPVSDEVWVDEIDNYHVTSRGCPVQEKKGTAKSASVKGELQ